MSRLSSCDAQSMRVNKVRSLAFSDKAQRIQFTGTVDRHSPSLNMHNVLRKHGFSFSGSSASAGRRWVTEFIREEPLSERVFRNMLNKLGASFRKVSLNESISK